MNVVEQLQCKLQESECRNKELKDKLNQFEAAQFQIISRDEAFRIYVHNTQDELFQIDLDNECISVLGDVSVREMRESSQVCYLVKKGGK